MRIIFNPFTRKPQYMSSGGGLYGINMETVTETKTLTPNEDYIYQYLNPNDANRVITLDIANAKAGDKFVIKNNGDWNDINYLEVKVGDTTYDKIYTGIFKSWIFDGTEWLDAWTGTGYGDISASREMYRGTGIGRDTQDKECGVAVGKSANAVLDGVAIGCGQCDAHDYGTAVGYSAKGHTYSVAVGHSAESHPSGLALGYGCNTNEFNRAVALGYYARNQRRCEIAMNIGDSVSNDRVKAYNQIVIGSWIRETTNNTPTTLYVDGVATERFNIRAQSSLTFKIMVTARDNTSGDCAAYLFDGLIKRDGANNTILCVCNKTVLHEDDDTWDCDVAADDTNEALQITVTGDAANNVRWAARLDGVETSWTALN